MKQSALLVAAAVTLSGCCGASSVLDESIATVILYRGGAAKKAPVHRIGARCYTAWYSGIEKLVLTSDGIIRDGPFVYRWMLDRRGPDDDEADRKWFAANCLDPPRVE